MCIDVFPHFICTCFWAWVFFFLALFSYLKCQLYILLWSLFKVNFHFASIIVLCMELQLWSPQTGIYLGSSNLMNMQDSLTSISSFNWHFIVSSFVIWDILYFMNFINWSLAFPWALSYGYINELSMILNLKLSVKSRAPSKNLYDLILSCLWSMNNYLTFALSIQS